MLAGAALGCSAQDLPRRPVARSRADALAVVPIMMQRILDLPEETIAKYDTSSLKVVAASGSALPGDLSTRWMDRFGDTLYNLYGSTEVAWATIATPADLRAAPGTAGRPPRGTVVKLLDEKGVEVKPGETGRIFVGNEMLFEGYTGGGSKDVVGNLMALVQPNLKRMLAYSTVSHVGFLFLGLAGGNAAGYAAAMFYAISYSIMAAAAFGAIVVLSNRGFEADRIDDFKGLNARDPWMAGMVLCIMASLAGVPPFLGFWAKLVVLRAALQGDMLWLAIIGIVFAVVGAFYYLRVIKVMYFDEPVGAPIVARDDRPLRLAFGVNALALLVLGIFWNPIMVWCQQSFIG